MINIIAAIDSKRGLGKNNDLLFKIPQDFERMKKLTMGHPIIMGRKTFESIGRVLPGRTNIIITQNSKLRIQGYVENSIEDAIEKAKESPGGEEIFIFGGGQVFKEAMDKGLVERLYLTVVEGDYDADTFFPDYSDYTNVVNKEEGKFGGYKYKFLDLGK